MLGEYFKTKQGEEEAREIWTTIKRNGHKIYNGEKVTTENFLEFDLCFCSYKVEKRYYQGYFTQQGIDDIFKVLNYYKGKITSLAG